MAARILWEDVVRVRIPALRIKDSQAGKFEMHMPQEKTLLLIDTNSIIHRAFHALPPLKTKEGSPGGAIYGSLLAFFKMLSDFDPDFVGAAFDFPGKTFRHEKYKEYKAHRPKAPEELISQIKETERVFSEMGVKVLKEEGLEADDIVGSVCSLSPAGTKVVIATGDLDLLQLAGSKIKVYTLKKGVKESVLHDENSVKEKYDGILPERIPDIKALQGDPSDNIPGIEGVGEKTAIKLIKEFDTIEELYEQIKENPSSEYLSKRIGKSTFRKLKEGKRKAFLSKELASIRSDGLSGLDIKDLSFTRDEERIKEVLDRLGFKTLANRFSRGASEEEKEEEEKNLSFGF